MRPHALLAVFVVACTGWIYPSLVAVATAAGPLSTRSSMRAHQQGPKPHAWPTQFHALLFENRTNQLGFVDLWYDWPGKRNLNIIRPQLGMRGGVTYDLEYDNHTSFYWKPAAGSCKRVDFPVGILTPDWLVEDSQYLGTETVNNITTAVFTKADFIIYWEEVAAPYRPVRWRFLTSGGQFEVLQWDAGATFADEGWQPPATCFP